MSALVPLSRRGARAGLVPFGLGQTKPRHYWEMLKTVWANRRAPLYAWRVLSRGVCDGCALGTTGLRDWTLDGTHLCLVRLGLLRLNTMGALDPSVLGDVERLRALPARALRDLGRLPYPMRRRRGERGFSRLSWEQALLEIGARIGGAPPERIALYLTSRGLTNEVYFAAQKAFRALGCPNIDNAARLCHAASTVAMKKMIGVSASTCSYRDWYGTDAIVFFGSNPANDQPVAMKYLHEAKKLGTRVFAVNTLEEPGFRRYWVPSSADSALFGTKIADRFFRVSAGGDLAFVLAVQKALLAMGAVDRAFLDAHTEGWPEYQRALARLDSADLARRAGVDDDDVEALARVLAEARTGVLVWSMGVTQHPHATETVMAIVALGLMRGFVGREKTGLMPIRGHSGVQGGAEMGAYATAFPGGLPVDAQNADAFARLWGFRPPDRSGLDAVAMIDAALDGALEVLYAVGGNFLDTLPQPERVERALGRVPLRLHQDIVLTHPMLVDPADAVYLLPARTRYEHRGGVTETTTERRVVYSPFIPGHEVGEAREEWWIPLEIARRARPEVARWLELPDARAIRDDIARTVPSYAGIERFAAPGDQLQWGGPRLCEGGQFPLPGGRARLFPLAPPDRQLAPGELWLSTRRGKQFNSMVQAARDGLTGAERDHVLMSREDMRRLGVAPDQRIVVQSDHGRFVGRAFPAEIAQGNVQMHWPEANVLLAAGRVDPHCRVPDYNARVRIEAA
jgi:molybdopterin-dependent oxidoreductase alpha subunit